MQHETSDGEMRIGRSAARLLTILAAAGLLLGGLLAVLTVPAAASPVQSHGGLSPVAEVAAVASGAVPGGHRVASRPHLPPACTFNGSSNAVQNVTAGGSITIACTGWLPNEAVVAGEVSPLFASTESVNEIDPNEQEYITDAAGDLNGTFVVPNPFTAPDPAAVCPPTAAQQSQYGDCFLALADQGENGGTVGLVYATSPTPAPAPVAAVTAVGIASTTDGGGYWIAWTNGNVTVHGDAGNYGNASSLTLNQPIAHIVATPDGRGYWLVAADGGTFAFGDAGFYGSMGGRTLNKPVVDIAPTADGKGYWLVASDGGIFAFGDATFHGSTGSLTLNKPMVGIAADNVTGGYWEVASDGGIFAFGAPFYGSTGSLVLNKPVNGMAATADSLGYWFVASDGGIFTGGDAAFHGSTGSLTLNAPIVGMAADPTTGGYWLVGSDGGVFAFGAPFYGAG